jgi:hypothetical protein
LEPSTPFKPANSEELVAGPWQGQSWLWPHQSTSPQHPHIIAGAGQQPSLLEAWVIAWRAQAPIHPHRCHSHTVTQLAVQGQHWPLGAADPLHPTPRCSPRVLYVLHVVCSGCTQRMRWCATSRGSYTAAMPGRLSLGRGASRHSLGLRACRASAPASELATQEHLFNGLSGKQHGGCGLLSQSDMPTTF